MNIRIIRVEKEAAGYFGFRTEMGWKVSALALWQLRWVNYFQIIIIFVVSSCCLLFLLCKLEPLSLQLALHLIGKTRRENHKYLETNWINWKWGPENLLHDLLYPLSLELKFSHLRFLLESDGKKKKEILLIITFNQFQKFTLLHLFPIENNQMLL